MGKQGEIDYLRKLGEGGVRHAIRKPFSDEDVGKNLAQIAAIFTLLPPLPARLLDVGCGTGWTSVFFAKRGYDVLGVDIAPDMIFHANQLKAREGLSNLHFRECDYEHMDYHQEFECAVFYDALHHAVDEELALRKTYQALKPGGLCIASEPGAGHQANPWTQQAVKLYEVTEKDMPPKKIAPLARKVGFRRVMVYPHAYQLNHLFFQLPASGRTTIEENGGESGRGRRMMERLKPRRLVSGIAKQVRIVCRTVQMLAIPYLKGSTGLVVLIK